MTTLPHGPTPPSAPAARAADSQQGGERIDWNAFEAALTEATADQRLMSWRALLNSATQSLHRQFLANVPIQHLVADRAQLVDRIIVRGWEAFSTAAETGIALIAVGGYGRRELHPASDIDLLLLSQGDARKSRETIANFLAFLWDLGLEVGHSTRTVAECREACKSDLSTATTLMESRLLNGPDKLYVRMVESISPPKVWPSRTFFEAKLKEQQARHFRYDDTAYNLEPNIKGSPGGLRDIQIIVWVTRRHYGTDNLTSLVDKGFITDAQLRILLEGRKFLWRLRYALHMLTGRREDRLLFDHQKRIAEMFGYEDAAYTLAVEQLMQRYYRTAMDISRLNEMLLQLFQEEILMNPNARARSLTADFEVKNGFLQVISNDTFSDTPSALLEMFLVLQQHQELKGVSASTIALLRRNLHLIDDEFRNNPRNQRLFLQILAAPEGVTHELRRMNAYGVLGQYIPAFGRIVGRMQYDLFHAYTVDAHTLFVVSNLRRFALTRFNHEFPRCSEIMQSLDRPEVAYLAGLFHDIAKGMGGDHSELGAVSAEAFCLEHGMSPYDSRLVAWLVRHHLLLSLTAQKKDINDPTVIHKFAQTVGDEKHLDYLYLLTVADVRATNPKLWNSWKAQLFHELYELTKRALRHGLENPVEMEELLRQRRRDSLRVLQPETTELPAIEALWQQLGNEYLLSCRPEEIAWHTRLLTEHIDDAQFSLVDVQEQAAMAGTAVLIYAPQDQFTFAIATAIIDEFGLSVTDARIISLANSHSLSIYTVLEQDGAPISEAARREKLRQRLNRAVRNSEDSKTLVTRKAPRQVRLFSTASQVSFAQDTVNGRTVMEITAGDRPGLAAEIGRGLRSLNVFIRMAKLVTVGERAEDVFYITDSQGAPLSSETQAQLQAKLISAIDNPSNNKADN